MRPVLALLQGLKLCFFTDRVRRHALWPWGIGFVAYCLSLVGAYYSHATVLDWIEPNVSGWMLTLLHPLAWLLAALMLLAVSIIVSVVLVSVLAGVFQSEIAKEVLAIHGIALGTQEHSLYQEARRTVFVELRKLLVLVPLMAMAFTLSWIPFLAPVAVVIAAWLLAFQFVDLTLDLFHLPIRRRIRFAYDFKLSFTCFGLILVVCWAVPFLGLLLSPIAAAGAAWMLSEDPYIGRIKELQGKI